MSVLTNKINQLPIFFTELTPVFASLATQYCDSGYDWLTAATLARAENKEDKQVFCGVLYTPFVIEGAPRIAEQSILGFIHGTLRTEGNINVCGIYMLELFKPLRRRNLLGYVLFNMFNGDVLLWEVQKIKLIVAHDTHYVWERYGAQYLSKRANPNVVYITASTFHRRVGYLKKMDAKREPTKKYKDLDLVHLRKVCGIDFAYHTYLPGQCTCCFSPIDIPQGWEGSPPEEIKIGSYASGGAKYGWSRDIKKCSYILFQNADNVGKGTCIKKLEYQIQHGTAIKWQLPDITKLPLICTELQRQLGSGYVVKQPFSEKQCIMIYVAGA